MFINKSESLRESAHQCSAVAVRSRRTACSAAFKIEHTLSYGNAHTDTVRRRCSDVVYAARCMR